VTNKTRHLANRHPPPRAVLSDNCAPARHQFLPATVEHAKCLFKGTNVLLIAENTIQTNVTFSSGSIDISAFAGQTNEFFVGIVGGTSTNAQLTVENLAFSISLPPSLQAQMSDGNLMLSWPMSAQNFNLQTTTNLADPNSWLTLTNVPAIVNLQNTITNPIVGSQGFYRLIQSQ
jgi:hypothetical protein